MAINDLAPTHEAIAILPAAVARQLRVAPLRKLGHRSLLVGVAEHSDLVALEAAAMAHDFYPVLEHIDSTELEQRLSLLDEADLQSAVIHASTDTHLAQAPVSGRLEAYLTDILEAALERRASDIHFEPTRENLCVRLRIDGRLLPFGLLPIEMRQAIPAQIKVLAKLPLAEKRLPLDGRLRMCGTDVRVSILPVLNGESVVLRIMGKQDALALSDLGLLDDQMTVIEERLRHPHGLLLVCGPTGSGKSTTLYTLLRRLADGQRKLISIEDPVETQVAGVTQVEARPPTVTFAGAIRSMLRHAPDVILVGEIRDNETLAAAMEATLSGHMVMASVHARDCAEAAVRLLDLGASRYVVGATLRLVISQRLARRPCTACTRASGPDCSVCHGSGSSGRRGAFEVQPFEGAVKDAFLAEAGAESIRAAAHSMGYMSLSQVLEALVQEGEIAHDDALTLGNWLESPLIQ